MNTYWDKLLEEVSSHKNHATLSLNESSSASYTIKGSSKKRAGKAKPRVRIYPLGMHAKDKYLTLRETQCVLYLLKGHNVPQTANNLNLSKRTVEFYLNKSKERLGCASNVELLKQLKPCKLEKKYEASTTSPKAGPNSAE